MKLFWLQSNSRHEIVRAETPVQAIEALAAWAEARGAGDCLSDRWSVFSTAAGPGPVRQGEALYLGGQTPARDGHVLSDYLRTGKATL